MSTDGPNLVMTTMHALSPTHRCTVCEVTYVRTRLHYPYKCPTMTGVCRLGVPCEGVLLPIAYLETREN